MTEWKLFDGDVPHVSTAAFHADRARAPHLEQPGHRRRLLAAAVMVRAAAAELGAPCTFSDVGCGDGGLLSLVQGAFTDAWGYDFCPANTAGWAERGVTAEFLDVFADPGRARLGDVTAATEVLEHLADPHGVLVWIRAHSARLVCSSPHGEDNRSHAAEHAWAWDTQGYAAMITGAGWVIGQHELAGPFQVVSAR